MPDKKNDIAREDGGTRRIPWGALISVVIFVVVLLLVMTFWGAMMGDPRGETIPPGP